MWEGLERVYNTFNANLSGTATNLLKLTAPLYCPTVAISRTEVILHLREKNCIIDFSVALQITASAPGILGNSTVKQVL